MKLFEQYGFAFKLSLYILTSTTILFTAIILINLFVTRKIILDDVREYAKSVSLYNVSRIERVLDGVEKVTNKAAKLLEESKLNHKQIHSLLKVLIKNNEEIFGGAILFEPGVYDKLYNNYAPYYYEDGDSLSYIDIAGVNIVGVNHYTEEFWYSVPFEKGGPVWSEPYFDEGIGNIIMTTYSVPFYTINNGKRVMAGIVTADLSLDWFEQIVSSVYMLESGFAVSISETGTFITHPKKEYILNESVFSIAEKSNDPRLKEYAEQMVRGETGFVPLESALLNKSGWMYFTKLPSSNWTLAVMFPEDELYSELNYLNNVIMFIGIFGFILLLLIIVIISKKLTKPLISLSAAATEIGDGNLNVFLPDATTKDEVGKLTLSMGQMQLKLKEYIKDLKQTTAEKEKIESELRIAQQIQHGMIPKIFPPFPDIPALDLYAKLLSAKEVGGDLYDFFFIDDTHLCIAIGDVSGKGVPASLLMAVTRTLLRAKATSGIRSDELVNLIDKELKASHDTRLFVTFFLGIIDLSTGEMDYTNSGHNPPYLIRSDGAIEKMIVNPGLPLGIGVQNKYISRKINIKPSETLVLFTDGVTEAMNTEDAMFKENGLEEVLKKTAALDVTDIVESVFESVKVFTNDVIQYDDITVVAFNFKEKYKVDNIG
ncbi:MAG: serine/threonine protein phosphatase [Ignavibacteriae bacterium]|nr:MAG: serine/threonine protein phosphatase [Ignavibacteriota bacterium]